MYTLTIYNSQKKDCNEILLLNLLKSILKFYTKGSVHDAKEK